MSAPVLVRYQPFRYTGWRRVWRRLTLRPVESPIYEFEAIVGPLEPYLGSGEDDDVSGFSSELKVVSPIRIVGPE